MCRLFFFVIFTNFLYSNQGANFLIRNKRFFLTESVKNDYENLNNKNSKICENEFQEKCINKTNHPLITYLVPPTPSSYVSNFESNPTLIKYANDFAKSYYEEGKVAPLGKFHPNTAENLGFQIKGLSCTDSPIRGFNFFTEIVSSKDVLVDPVLEQHSTYCQVIRQNQRTFQIYLQGPQMEQCGVKECNGQYQQFGIKSFCLTIRFPIVHNLKTNEDIVMNLRCHLQQPVITHNKLFRIKPINTNFERANLLPNYLDKTSDTKFHSHVGLYRFSKTNFDTPVNDGDSIILGEELQLRCTVRAGDGWQYSRIGSVKFFKQKSRIGDSYGSNIPIPEEDDSITVIAEDGCVNPVMKSVCPHGQTFDPENPLLSTLNMKAFTFTDMMETDQMVLSVTIHACIHYEDCFPTTLECSEWMVNSKKVNRRRRLASSNNYTADGTTEIQYKVKIPLNKAHGKSNFQIEALNMNQLFSIICIIGIIGIVVLFIILFAFIR